MRNIGFFSCRGVSISWHSSWACAPIGRHLLNPGSSTPINRGVMFCMIIITSTPELERERERDMRVKGTVLDAYHQTEFKSCNRSKKHPRAEKWERRERRQRHRSMCSGWNLETGFAQRGADVGLIKLSTGADGSGCKWGNRPALIGWICRKLF